MKNLKVCILAVFLIFGFVLVSSGDIFWLVLYLIGCGVIWCCTRFFNKCSKNSPTSSGGEMNCTSEHICSKKSL